ncbi:hypothetical protein PoB_003935800 [Plakobranchus ocellatus]|uniref:Uncharacterized protein n=1 Tax=Plakobranchus ocellatus TaxID=259542 RepID=A0AAV4B2A4_9GAST|nr:hypothetical protein PoB_003935800 [Plakobranchus ocellatus]
MSTVAVQTGAPWTYCPSQGQAAVHIGDWCLTALFWPLPRPPYLTGPSPSPPTPPPPLSPSPGLTFPPLGPPAMPILPALVHLNPYNLPAQIYLNPILTYPPTPTVPSAPNISIPPGFSKLPQP